MLRVFESASLEFEARLKFSRVVGSSLECVESCQECADIV